MIILLTEVMETLMGKASTAYQVHICMRGNANHYDSIKRCNTHHYNFINRC